MRKKLESHEKLGIRENRTFLNVASQKQKQKKERKKRKFLISTLIENFALNTMTIRKIR